MNLNEFQPARQNGTEMENGVSLLKASRVTYEEILEKVGSSGRWQFWMFFIASTTGIFAAAHNIGAVFTAYLPDEYYCEIPHFNESNYLNWTVSRAKAIAFPPEDGSLCSRCTIYDRNYSLIFSQMWSEELENRTLEEQSIIRKCEKWFYDKLNVHTSVVTQWDLVCDRSYLRTVVQSTYMAGVMIGSSVHGFISDRYGRRLSMLIGVIELFIPMILASFAPYYGLFVALRFIGALGVAGTYTVGFICCTENCSAKLRDLFGIEYEIPFGLGYMLLPAIAYFVRDWPYLQLAISVPSILLVAYYWVLPESPRWLISRGLYKKSVPILKSIAKMNRKTPPRDEELLEMVADCYKQGQDKSGTEHVRSNADIYLDLLRTPQMRKQTLISYFTWFTVSVSYYGLAFNLPDLIDGFYLVNFILAIVEFPAYIVGYLMVRYIGRKWSTTGNFLLGGVACLIVIAIPHDLKVVTIAVSLLGKFCIAIVFAVLFLYTTEIFPTPNRNIALGSSAMFARIGGIVVPFIVNSSASNPKIPMVVFGALSVLSGVLTAFLPETKNKKLPETIEEVECINKKSSAL